MSKATYMLATYDVADDPGKDGDWTVRAQGLTLFQLRGPLREWRAAGYSNVSILVERED
jgi:hypothetical protein